MSAPVDKTLQKFTTPVPAVGPGPGPELVASVGPGPGPELVASVGPGPGPELVASVAVEVVEEVVVVERPRQ